MWKSTQEILSEGSELIQINQLNQLFKFSVLSSTQDNLNIFNGGQFSETDALLNFIPFSESNCFENY